MIEGLAGDSLNAQEEETVVSDQVLALHQWLQVGASEKARSVVELAQPVPHETILEIGSGSGAVLESLAGLKFGSSYFAVEPSQPLFEYMVHDARIPALTAENAVLSESTFVNRRFDLVILSHVVEHVVDPADLILQASRLSNALIIEVPLEGSLAGNLRAETKRLITGRDRRLNPAGHINFFARGDLDKLVGWCGLDVRSRRTYHPSAQLRYQSTRAGRLTKATSRLSLLAARVLGDETWARTYHGHYAVLAVPRTVPAGDGDDVALSQPLYFPPRSDRDSGEAQQELSVEPKVSR